MRLSDAVSNLTGLAAGHHGGSVWEHAPEVIAVGVGFVAFMSYVLMERRSESMRSRGLRTPAPDGRQWFTVSLLVIAGIGHIPIIGAHLTEAPYMGALFICFVLAAFTTAVALARTNSPGHYALAGGLCASAVLAYIATRVLPFPQLSDDVGAWLEPLGVLCVLVETAVVAVALLEIRRVSIGPARPDSVTAS